MAAGDQVAEHGVQPAGDLVAGPGQVAVPLSPHLQYRPVVIGDHLAADRGPQRRDRYRQGVVGVVLVRVPGLQQPYPGRQLRLHIQDPLAGGGELLGEQAPQAAQVRSGHAAAHPMSFPAWPAEARTLSSPSGSSAGLITTAVCEPLCGSTPIITAAISTLQVVTRNGERGGHA